MSCYDAGQQMGHAEEPRQEEAKEAAAPKMMRDALLEQKMLSADAEPPASDIGGPVASPSTVKPDQHSVRSLGVRSRKRFDCLGRSDEDRHHHEAKAESGFPFGMWPRSEAPLRDHLCIPHTLLRCVSPGSDFLLLGYNCRASEPPVECQLLTSIAAKLPRRLTPRRLARLAPTQRLALRTVATGVAGGCAGTTTSVIATQRMPSTVWIARRCLEADIATIGVGSDNVLTATFLPSVPTSEE